MKLYNIFRMPDFLHPDKENYSHDELMQEEKIRPQSFSDFAGQRKTLDNLEVFVAAAKNRGGALDHVLLHGPPGLGKTTLAHIIANELGVNCKITSGPVLDKPGSLAGLLTNLEENDVLFIKSKLGKKGVTMKKLAHQFGVSEMQIHRIKTGENWSHVKTVSELKAEMQK